MRIGLDCRLISKETTVFDYGCGHGDDLRRLRKLGVRSRGWDPYHRAEERKEPAHVVNLGFVLNVIENPVERASVLRDAWALSKTLLLVSARHSSEERTESGKSFSDGVLTSRGTFQKFFDQVELRTWVEAELEVPAISVEPGIVFVFRRDEDRHDFLSRRFRRRSSTTPRLRNADDLYDQHRESFEELLDFWSERGRAPKPGELDREDALRALGSPRRAVQALRTLIGREELERLRKSAKDGLLVYLALDRFGGRPRFGQLSDALKADVRAHFGSYKGACKEADQLLFHTGNPLIIDAECRDSSVGKLTPTALYVHVSALPELSSVLRVYEGCARALLGEVPEANVVKLSRREPSISYLSYPGFERDPHPPLNQSYIVDLKALKARYRDFSESANPPILHRKELFLPATHLLRKKFARLTAQEERWGLLSNDSHIGTLRSWNGILREAGVLLRGHRLIRS